MEGATRSTGSSPVLAGVAQPTLAIQVSPSLRVFEGQTFQRRLCTACHEQQVCSKHDQAPPASNFITGLIGRHAECSKRNFCVSTSSADSSNSLNDPWCGRLSKQSDTCG